MGPYVALVILHAVCGWHLHQPRIFADELGYLGHARYLSGTGIFPNMGTTTYYHFGYSLLLLPAFWMSSAPGATYRAVMITNAVVISLLYFPLRYVLEHAFGSPKALASSIAFVTCLYPAFALQSNFAWAENALIPGYALLVATFARLVRKSSYTVASSFGVLAGVLYTIHPRAVTLLVSAPVVLAALSAARIVTTAAAAGGAACTLLVLVATHAANGHLRATGWLPQKGSVDITAYVYQLVTSPSEVVATIAGQLLYLTQATYGIFLLGPVYACMAIMSRDRAAISSSNRAALLTATFIGISALSLMVPAAAMSEATTVRADHLIYGRYNEVFLSVYLAIGLLLLSTRVLYERKTVVVPAVLIGFAVLTAFVLLTRAASFAERSSFVGANILGIYPAARLIGRIRVDLITLASGGTFVFLWWMFGRSVLAGLACTAVAFSAVSAFDYRFYAGPPGAIPATSEVLPSRIRQMSASHVNFEWGTARDFRRSYYLFQYLLPHTRLEPFLSKHGQRPNAPVVIAHQFWRDAQEFRARLVTTDEPNDLALWVLPQAPEYYSAARSFLDVALGGQRVPGVWDSGFHHQERSRAILFRWTHGHATLVVPIDPRQRPTELRLLLFRSTSGDVRIRANDLTVYDGHVDARAVRRISIRHVPMADWLSIELLSGVVEPSEHVPGSRDVRRLGVAVREIRLSATPAITEAMPHAR
jgi:hypothetical protein